MLRRPPRPKRTEPLFPYTTPFRSLVQSVRTLGTVSSAAELAQVSLPLPDGRRPRLADIATVKDTHAQRSQLALLDGKPVIGFDVMRARGHDDVGTSKGVYAAIGELKRAHPEIHFTEVVNTVEKGRAHDCTPVTNAHLVCRLLLEKKN